MKCAALLVFIAAVLGLQTASEVEITAEPYHHLIFSNDQVRVFNVEVPPGTSTQLHAHRHDYVSITLGAAQIRNTVRGKAPVEVKFQDGETRFIAGSFSHTVTDLGEQPFRNLTIEYLQDDKLRTVEVHWDEDRGLDVLDKGTRHVLFTNDGVRVSEFDLQAGGAIPVHHHKGPYLLVALTDLNLRSDVQGGMPSQISLKAHEVQWRPGRYSHSVTNIGAQPAKFMTLEFP